MTLRPVWFLLIFFIISESVIAQTKSPLLRRKDAPKGTESFGVAAGFNQISGLTWEFQLKDKRGQLSRSTLSLSGGYSSRYPEFETITIIDSIPYITKKRVWTHGVGASGMINNYLQKNLQGWMLSFGVAGHVFFKNKQLLKTMSVTALAGYKKTWSSKLFLQAQVGAAVMGTPLKSSSGSEINGFFIMARTVLQYRIN